MPTGSSTSAPVPATTAAGSSSRAPRPISSPPAPPSPASTSRPTSAPDQDPRGPNSRTPMARSPVTTVGTAGQALGPRAVRYGALPGRRPPEQQVAEDQARR